MRFFKAFNLLHRRTGSATFVPGGPRFSLDSADPNPAVSLSLFDLVTSRKPFSDVKDDHWWSRRSRDTNSLTNIQPSLRQEHRHPVEFVDFWIEECSKLRDLLKCCHTELLDQRSITIALERKINESSQEIAYLRMSLARGILAGPPATSAHDQIPIVHAAASRNITTISTNSHTSDQYSSALRITLQTRKALRDQKKITKYWKNLAVTGPQNTVTPSVSAISSIRETLPAHRQVAVEALMARRSLNTLLDDLRSESILSEVLCSTSEEINRHSFHAGLHETATTLPSSLSRGPQLSRLGPLASESIKHEVNLLFGSSSRPKRLSSSISSLQFRNSFSSKEELSHTTSFSHSINSFRDLNTFFQRTFGADQILKDDIAPAQTREVKDVALISQCISSDPPSSSCLPETSFPTDSSHTWVNIQPVNSNTRFKPITNLELRSSPQQATKECMHMQSMQTLEARSNPNRRKRSEIIQHSANKGYERKGAFALLPLFKRRHSVLPIFCKREPCKA